MPMTQQQIYPRNAYAQPSYCNWFYLGAQASGDIENKITSKAAAIKHASFSDASCWANAGFATVGGGATNYATIDSATADLQSLATHSLVVAFTVKKSVATYPAVENYLYASYKPGSQYGGIVVASMTTGNARLYLNSTDNTTVSLTTAVDVVSDNSNILTKTIVFIVPRNGATGYFGINGLEAGSGSISTISSKALAGGRTARWGASLAGVAIDTHRMSSFQCYSVPADLTSRLPIYDWVQRNPHVPIPDWVFGL